MPSFLVISLVKPSKITLFLEFYNAYNLVVFEIDYKLILFPTVRVFTVARRNRSYGLSPKLGTSPLAALFNTLRISSLVLLCKTLYVNSLVLLFTKIEYTEILLPTVRAFTVARTNRSYGLSTKLVRMLLSCCL